MCLMPLNMAHATPITNFTVIENISDNIIGGNTNRLVVEYNSQDIDVIYNFRIISPYPFWNNTPEIPYLAVDVDNIILNCTNRTTHNNTIFELVCDYRIEAGHHNTTAGFRFAPNIMPGNYGFEFEILHYTPDSSPPQPQYSGSGSSGTTTIIPNTKLCTFKVIRDWIAPLPLVHDVVEPDVPDINATNTTTNITTTDNMTDIVDDALPIPPDYNIILIVFGGFVCGAIFVRLWYRKKAVPTEPNEATMNDQ